MKITKEGDELVLRLPLWQEDVDAIGDPLPYKVMNLIGVIAGDQYSISQAISLGYKDDVQEGMPIIMLDTEEQLRKVCADLNIEIWIHDICVKCKKVIYGSFTWKDGPACYSCNE